MILNLKSRCCQKEVKEIWRGLLLLHVCKNCGKEFYVGKIVYYDSRGFENEKDISNY